MTQSYVEREPRPELAGAVRALWVQRTGATAFVQRNLPHGGVEIHFPIGGRAELVGPLTGPNLEVVPPRTTLVGVRFHPGTSPPLPTVLDDLVDQRVDLADVWGGAVDRLGELMADASDAYAALDLLQDHLLQVFRRVGGVDPLVREAVRLLMPWRPFATSAVAEHLAISASQLRRRCLHAIGVGPKTLQRTLRFQGFLALAQADVGAAWRGNAALAAEVGYADQAHLNRECLSLTGLTPRDLVGRCECGHDHAASYAPFLANRVVPLRR